MSCVRLRLGGRVGRGLRCGCEVLAGQSTHSPPRAPSRVFLPSSLDPCEIPRNGRFAGENRKEERWFNRRSVAPALPPKSVVRGPWFSQLRAPGAATRRDCWDWARRERSERRAPTQLSARGPPPKSPSAIGPITGPRAAVGPVGRCCGEVAHLLLPRRVRQHWRRKSGID